MIKLYRDWREHRKAKRYREGFGWAMASYYLGDLTTDEIASYPNEARRMGIYDDLEAGIEHALRIIHNSNAYRND